MVWSAPKEAYLIGIAGLAAAFGPKKIPNLVKKPKKKKLTKNLLEDYRV